MASKKILMVNDHIHFGGGGDAAFQLEKIIFEGAGHEVYTFSQSAKKINNVNKNDFIFIESDSKYKRKLGKFFGCRSISSYLKDVLYQIEPDLIKLHLLSKYPADIYNALNGYPVVQILHGPNLFCATSWGALKKDSTECEQGIGFKCLKRGCIRAYALPLHLNLARRTNASSKAIVDCFFSPSHQLAKTANSLGFTPVEYFPLSVDPIFEKIKPKYSDDGIILFVGALAEQKGITYLIDCMPHILKRHPWSKLQIAGRGNLEADLRKRVKDLGLEEVIEFLGFQDRKSILKLYLNASVVVVPSIWREQFGLVGPEALACGVPCVGSNIGGIPEWLHHEKSGLLVAPRSVAELSLAIEKLLEDKSLRKRYGDYGREFVLSEYSFAKYQKNVLAQIERFAN